MSRKPKTTAPAIARRLPQGIDTGSEQEQEYYNLPVSSHADMMYKVLGTGSELAELPAKAGLVSNTQQIEIYENRNRRRIVAKGHNAETIIEVSDLDKLIGSNKSAKKMLQLVLIKMNEQAYDYDKGLHSDFITFNLQELVDIGYYSSIRAARRGYKDAMSILTDLKVQAKFKGKKNTEEATAEGVVVLFPTAKVENNQCAIRITRDISWKPLMRFFTILPRFAFQLGNRGFDLLYTIFFLARQNAQAIKEKGYFTIGFRTIQQRLDLPNEKDNKDPQRTIKKPIENAIEEIEQQAVTAGHSGYLKIIPVYDSNAGIKEYLDSGYLRIELKENFLHPFIEQGEHRERMIAANRKRQQAIVDKAKAAALQKKLEAEQEQEQAAVQG